MGKHNTFGQTGCSWSIDQCGKVVGVYFVRDGLHLWQIATGSHLQDLWPILTSGNVLNREDMLQGLHLVPDLLDLGYQVWFLGKTCFDAGIIEDVLIFTRANGWIDRNIDSADLTDAKIHDIPFRAIFLDDGRDLISRLDPEL